MAWCVYMITLLPLHMYKRTAHGISAPLNMHYYAHDGVRDASKTLAIGQVQARLLVKAPLDELF
jgi:hypothetical protein